MAVTEFMTEIENGPVDSGAITVSMVSDDTSIALWGPVVLADGAIDRMPRVASTASAGNAAVFGVCVKLTRSGTLVADSTHVEVCIHGICKVKVNDADVALNDPLQTHSTAGEAAIQADPAVNDGALGTLATGAVDAISHSC